MSTNVILTGKISLFLQFIVGVLDAYALTLPRSRDVLLRDLLKVELGVQTIEFGFYAWMVRTWGSHGLQSIVQFRYYDWMLTTPTMLITLMAFLGASPDQSLQSFIRQHLDFIAQVVFLNLLMLLLGLGGEMGYIPQTQSVVLGFIPFFTYYALIYERFIRGKKLPSIKVKLFYYFFTIWSIYGIVALFPLVTKNIGYNILDLFSKNLVGVILSVMLLVKPVS
jgi:bacteriorhodopsin